MHPDPIGDTEQRALDPLIDRSVRAYRCLSVRQPWAHAILHFGKPVENRTWARDVPEPFECLLHAGKAFEHDTAAWFLEDGLNVPVRYAVGCLVGIVTVTGCIAEPRTEAEREWWTGPYAFTLENPRPFTRPIPYVGKLGFFWVPTTHLEHPFGEIGYASLDAPISKREARRLEASGTEAHRYAEAMGEAQA